MDIGAVLAAVAGAFGGGAATAVGGMARSRSGARTAARLIYAELTRGGAAVAYFRMSGTWPAGTLTLTAWEHHGRSLAQLRRSRAFDAVHRGYAALEAVQYLASDVDLAGAQRDGLLDDATTDLADAFRAIGDVARIPRGTVDAEVRRLLSAAPLPELARRLSLPGVVPPLLLSRMIDHGGADLQVAASRSRVPAEALRRARPAPARRLTEAGIRLVVYDAGHQNVLERERLTQVRVSGAPPTGDPDVDDAYDAMAATAAFTQDVLRRSSIDGVGTELSAAVHYGQNFNNAFWSGELLFLGDGDGRIFRRFSGCPDVVAHELFHALPGIADLSFYGQSGALVESLCDVLAMLVVQYTRREAAAEASWILGENLLVADVRGVGLRSLKAPGTAYDDETLGKDPQHAHMDGFVATDTDNGGVHINSGIPSHAFYRLATALGGRAWERAGLIWYDAITTEAPDADLDFHGFARRTIAAADRRHGIESEETRATREAWDAVGLPPRA